MTLNEKMTKVREKLDKEFPGYGDAINGMTISELKETLINMGKNVEEILLAKEDDEKLQDTIDLKNELEAPYNEALKKAKMKLQFMNLLLKEKTDTE